MKILVGLLFVYFLYLIFENIYKKIWDKGLSVSVAFKNNIAVEGDENELTEIVVNEKFLPLPMIKVNFYTHRNITFGKGENAAKTDKNYRADIFTMLPYQKITRRLPFKCSKRGFYTIDNVSVNASDPLMTLRLLTSFTADTSLLVYPKGVEAQKLEVPFSKMIGMVIANRFSYEDPFEFRTIRQYQSYDSMKSVNWKASAKTDSLLVNAYNYTVEQEICLLLNFECDTTFGDEGLLEEALQLASSLTGMFIEKGIPLSMYTNGVDMITGEMPSCERGCGKQHILTVRESLARIVFPEKVTKFSDMLGEIASKTGENVLPVLITPSVGKELAEEYFARYPQSVWIVMHRPDFIPEMPQAENCTVIPWEVEY